MIKKLMILLAGLAVISACGFENRKGYFFDNHRFNYVRAEKLSNSTGENINHPFTFSEPEMSTILKMVEIKKGSAFTKNEKEKSIFDGYSINKLTPALVKAFATITPEQRVGFSFMMKSPTFILKNDRLTAGWMWVEDGKLHIDFDLIYVKINSDTDKMGYTAMRQTIAKSKGLRVALDLQPGQEYGATTRELVIDTGMASKIAEQTLAKEKELAERGVDAEVKIEVVKEKSVRERMRELDTLRKERMITEEEYQKKRSELLGRL